MNVINHCAVFMLGRKEDDLRVFGGANSVAGRPVEEVATVHRFFAAVGVSHDHLPFDQETPMRGLAEVVLKSLQQTGEISSRTHRKVFARHLAVASGVSEIEGLAGNRAGNVNLNGYILFVDSHSDQLVLGFAGGDRPSFGKQSSRPSVSKAFRPALIRRKPAGIFKKSVSLRLFGEKITHRTQIRSIEAFAKTSEDRF
jgi:hypothetical protein